MSAVSVDLGRGEGVDMLSPLRVRHRSTGEDDARDDLLCEELVDVEGDLLRPPVGVGNGSIGALR